MSGAGGSRFDAAPLAPHLALYSEAARRGGWRFELLDSHSGPLARIGDGRRSFLVAGGRACIYPLNLANAVDVARDKAHTANLLALSDVAVPDGGCFFLRPAHRHLRGPGREAGDAIGFARRLGYPVCVKPNDGARGHQVDYAYDDRSLQTQLEEIARSSHAAIVQQAIDAPEYRLFVLDGRVRFAYRRLRSQLTGDGERTVIELLAATNRSLADRGLSLIAADSGFLGRQLEGLGIGLHDVVPAGVAFSPAPRANLAAGGRLDGYRETVPPAVDAWGGRIARLTGLRVPAIDLFARNGPDDADGFVVLEVNGNPSLRGVVAHGSAETAYAILHDVCAAFFGG